jgi:hypothetical protein
MTILLAGAFIAGLVVWGFVPSWKHRDIDRQHFAAFVGFSGAIVAATATTFESVVADLYPHTMIPAVQGSAFVAGVIAIISIFVTSIAGLFSRGIQRIALVSCGIVVALMYLFVMVSHFGD